MDDLFSETSDTDKPIVVVTVGSMGCGKSSSLKIALQKLGYEKDQFINIDADDIKSKLRAFKKG